MSNQSEPLPQDVQTAIDQLAKHRTVLIGPDVQEVIDIAKVIKAAGLFHFGRFHDPANNDVFRAAIQVRFGRLINW